MKRHVVGALALLAMAGCSANESAETGDEKAPVDERVELVQSRYGECLDRIGASNGTAGLGLVWFETDKGDLEFTITERGGKTYTVPRRAGDVRRVAAAGC